MTTKQKWIAGIVGAFVAFAVVGAFIPADDDEPPASAIGPQAPTALIDIDDDPPPAPTATAEPAPTDPPVVFTDDEIAVLAFRSLTRNLDGGTSDNLSDQDIIDFAGAACDLAELSNDAEDFAMFAIAANANTGMSNDDAAYTMGALVGAFCPEQADRLGFG